jgi:hypothetical protein
MNPGDLVKCTPRRVDHVMNQSIGLLVEPYVPAGGPGFIMRDRWNVLIDGRIYPFWLNELSLISEGYPNERS